VHFCPLDGGRAASSDRSFQGPAWRLAFSGALCPAGWEPCSKGRLAICEDLEGELDTTGLDRIECVIAIEAQDPKALGTRYLS
jgi:hypothetical protein